MSNPRPTSTMEPLTRRATAGEPPSGTKSATAISVTSDMDLGEDSRERTVELPTSLEALVGKETTESPTKNPTEVDSCSDVTYDCLEASVKAEELSTLRTTIEEQKREIEEQKKENSKLQATVDEQKAQLEEAGRSDAANRENIASYLLANSHLAMQLGAEERRKARYKAKKAAMQAQIESLKERAAAFEAEYIRVRDGFVGYVNDMRPIIKKFQKNGSHTFDFVE